MKEARAFAGAQRLREGLFILICMFAVLVLAALVSFNSADPSWSQTAGQATVSNAVGLAGAWVADLLFSILGFFAYSLPALLILAGWLGFWQDRSINCIELTLRAVGCLLSVIGFTGLLSLNARTFYYFLPGGIIGELITLAAVPVFGLLGATLLLLAIAIVGLTLLTGISWLTVTEKLGCLILSLLCELRSVSINIARWLKSIKKQKARTLIDEKNSVFSLSKPRSRESLTIANNSQEPMDLLDDNEPSRSVNENRQTHKHQAYLRQQTALPSLNLLDSSGADKLQVNQQELDCTARLVEARLADFNVEVKVTSVYPGPVITCFELELAPGVKVSRISSLAKDLARALSATSVRVVEVIPGKSVVGLELPNKHREMVSLSNVINGKEFKKAHSHLSLALGKNILGNPVVVDLAKMPHLLIAGTTGSGKSVGVNVMILSLLYKSTPADVRFILIDPKMLELSAYEGIPHLLTEVVTDMKEAVNALRWCVGEMERRYKLMSRLGVRNLQGYNAKVIAAEKKNKPIGDPFWQAGEHTEGAEQPVLTTLPRIVVVVDEFADMMMVVGKKVEEFIARIAQKARAAGIHLILATQRPSVDVITGLIKANIPTRIAFQVSSKIDSRTILDQQGAESLLGQGDMLYLPPGSGVPTRIHGAFVDDGEVHRVVADWRSKGEPKYITEILLGEAANGSLLSDCQSSSEEQMDAIYDEAVIFVTESRRASISGVQRKFKIGYNRAARIIEFMEAQGVVSAPGHNGNREVLAPPPV